MMEAGSDAAAIVRPVAYPVKPASLRAIAAPRPTPRLAPVTSAMGIRIVNEQLVNWRVGELVIRLRFYSPNHQVTNSPIARVRPRRLRLRYGSARARGARDPQSSGTHPGCP